MAKRSRRTVKRHRLLIYHRLGQRLRTLPFLIALAGAALLALGWLSSQEILQAGDQALLTQLWERRIVLYLLIGASVLLYLLSLLLSWNSYVEAGPKTLNIRAGLIPVDISYGRIRQIRLNSLGTMYPYDKQKGPSRALVEEFEGLTCTVVDLQSVPWPFTKDTLRRVWHKFMFTPDGNSLMFVVPDAMVLNQQIDGHVAARMARMKSSDRYLDPVERAAKTHQQRLGGRRK